ncbi:MAG: hypothetical protein JXB17_01930 [Bacteroidales bacterium]|nr:hypothetical protein [Bacteroidales bacterium]
MKKGKKIGIAASVFAAYLATMLTANILMEKATLTHNDNLEMISGVLLGFFGIPILSILMPIILADKWKIPYSVWPKSKNALLVIFILFSYLFLANYNVINSGKILNYSLRDVTIHFFSSMLFHVTYYPLFAILILGVLREKYNLTISIGITSLLFAIYHLAQYHFFPGGITLQMQVLLFLSFTASLLFYLWSESLLLVALVHSANGAIGLIENGTIFNQVDFVFYLTIIIISSLVIYLIIREILQRKRNNYKRDFWLHIN